MMRRGTMNMILSLILVMITVIIVMFLLTRISRPVDVETVGGVYFDLLGESSPPTQGELLSFEQGKLILHTDKLSDGETLTLLTFPATPENGREYTKSPPFRLTLPSSFITVYALSIRQGRSMRVQRYVLINPTKERLSFGDVEEGIMTALQHGVQVEDLMSMLAQYVMTNGEREAGLDWLVRSNGYVCSRTSDSNIMFTTCRKRDGTFLFNDPHRNEEDERICITHVWDGRLPEGVTCQERDSAREQYQLGGRLRLLLGLLDRLNVLVPENAECTKKVRPYIFIMSHTFDFDTTSPSHLEKMRTLHDFYAERILFSPLTDTLIEKECTYIIPLRGGVQVQRIA